MECNRKDQILRLSSDQKRSLKTIAEKIFENNKGLLATDESPGTLGKKLKALGMENSEENRKDFRNCFYNTSNMENYISGVIMNEEAFDQVDSKGCSFTEILLSKGILAGLKVDKGLMEFGKEEFISVGIEDLENRLKEKKYKNAHFTKWRSFFVISPEKLPTDECIDKNCLILTKYAFISQENGRVPVIEPEISFKGCYTAEEMIYTAKKIYSTLFKYLNEFNIYIPGAILKVSFIMPGQDSSEKIKLEEIARLNHSVFSDSIPPSIAGIVFLSGGHNTSESFKLLSAVKKHSSIFRISFSFARALTNDPLEIWRGSDMNLEKARKRLSENLEECLKANKGEI